MIILVMVTRIQGLSAVKLRTPVVPSRATENSVYEFEKIQNTNRKYDAWLIPDATYPSPDAARVP